VKSVDYTSDVSIPEDKYRVGATAHGIPKKLKQIVSLSESDILRNQVIA